MVRVLICPEAFSGSLTAVQAAEAMAHGWRRRAPHDEVTLAPLSSGGSGFLDVMTAALGGTTIAVTVSDPLGRPVPAAVLLVEAAGVRTAYLEAAQACGLHLLAANERDPSRTSSLGVGQLVQVAMSEGAHRIVVGLGGSATNDAGAGLLASLGAGDPAHLACGASRMAQLPADSLRDLAELRALFRHVEIVVATESQAPLLGNTGPTATTACTKGAAPQEVAALEAGLAHFADVAASAVPRVKDLFSGLDRRVEWEAGAGASGGLGYALLLLGGRRHSIVDLVLQAWSFEDLLSRHDLVVTGEASLDFRSLSRGVVCGVAGAAARHALATVVLAGQVQLGRRDVMALGVAGAYAVAENSQDQAAAAADPVGTLEARSARLAATWSPR